MCRLLAVYPTPNGLYRSAGIVRSFRKLAVCGAVKHPGNPGHPDGWGILTWNNYREPVYLGREPTDASKDEKFETACDIIANSTSSFPLIAHLRKASVGLKIRENTHPFVRGKWAFAHNGTIRGLNLRKETDSEWFFDEVMAKFSRNGGNLIQSIAEVIDRVKRTYRYSSITFLLCDGNELYAYRDHSPGNEYYTMYFTTAPVGVVFCQEKIFESDWQELENGELVKIDKGLRPIRITLPEPQELGEPQISRTA